MKRSLEHDEHDDGDWGRGAPSRPDHFACTTCGRMYSGSHGWKKWSYPHYENGAIQFSCLACQALAIGDTAAPEGGGQGGEGGGEGGGGSGSSTHKVGTGAAGSGDADDMEVG